MSVTSGFFNSHNGDRRYTAKQFSELINTLIIDGVFSNVGTAFSVKAGSGNSITVGIGRAWFNSVWVYNDALFPMTVRSAEIMLDRIDAVVIEINHSETVRAASIQLVNGVPSGDPERPELTNTDDVHQYPLAYIYRKAGNDNVTQADITNMVGTSACPYVIGILDTQNIDALVAQWNSEFNIWFESLENILDGDVAGNIALRILELEEKFRVLAEEKAVYDDLKDSSDETIQDRNGFVIQGRTSMVGDSSGSYSNYYEDIEKVYEAIKNVRADDTFSIGDILQTARTDLGPKWLLCNGSSVRREAYPKLAELISPNPDFDKGWTINKNLPWASGSSSYLPVTNLKYVNGYYVAMGQNYKSSNGHCYGVIAYATDLKGSWTLKELWEDTGTNACVYDVIYAGGYYVAVGKCGGAGRIAYATTIDGVWGTKDIWGSTTETDCEGIRSICYDGSHFVVAGQRLDSAYDNAQAAIAYATSPSGSWTVKAIWVPITSKFSNASKRMMFYYVTYLNETYIACGAKVDEVSTGSSTSTLDEYGAIAYASSLTGSWTTKNICTDYGNSLSYARYIDYVNGQYMVTAVYYQESNKPSGQVYTATELDGSWKSNLVSFISGGMSSGTHMTMGNIIYVDGWYLTTIVVYDGVSGTSHNRTHKFYYSQNLSGWKSYEIYTPGQSTEMDTVNVGYANGMVFVGYNSGAQARVAFKDLGEFTLPTISSDLYTYIKALR